MFFSSSQCLLNLNVFESTSITLLIKPSELEFGFFSEQIMLDDRYQTIKSNQICIMQLNEGESPRKEKCLFVKHATFCPHKSSCIKKVEKLICKMS